MKRRLNYSTFEREEPSYDDREPTFDSFNLTSESTELISAHDEREFVHFLREILMLENTLENAKYDLMQQSDFSVINAFKFFDKSGSGFIHY